MRLRRNGFQVVAAAVAVSFSAQALADSLRCATQLISEGALAIAVKETCGEPTSVETATEPVYERWADGTVHQVGVETFEYWYYDFGSRRRPVRMTFRAGIAEKIERLSRKSR